MTTGLDLLTVIDCESSFVADTVQWPFTESSSRPLRLLMDRSSASPAIEDTRSERQLRLHIPTVHPGPPKSLG